MNPKGKHTEQQVRELSSEEAAWVGAMVEGEGSIRLRGRTKPGSWVVIGAHTRNRLASVDILTPMSVDVYSSDVETIATVLRLVGAGDVYYRPPRPDYVSPRGRRAFAQKAGWQWTLKYKELISALLSQIRPYLTSKRDLAMYAVPIGGASCHPTHWESGPLPGKTDEEITRNWEQFRKEDEVNPRAIRRQHRWKAGHEPDYLEPESGWKYVQIELESNADPDQRDELHGGPESGLPCSRCNTMTNVCGETTMWDIYNQENVSVVNLDDMTDSRRSELREMSVVILCCPECKLKSQWLEEFLPTKVHRAEE